MVGGVLKSWGNSPVRDDPLFPKSLLPSGPIERQDILAPGPVSVWDKLSTYLASVFPPKKKKKEKPTQHSLKGHKDPCPVTRARTLNLSGLLPTPKKEGAGLGNVKALCNSELDGSENA